MTDDNTTLSEKLLMAADLAALGDMAPATEIGRGAVEQNLMRQVIIHVDFRAYKDSERLAAACLEAAARVMDAERKEAEILRRARTVRQWGRKLGGP